MQALTTYQFPAAHIAVFARAPVPGRCKTRLIPAVGPAGAARVQRQLLVRTLDTVATPGLAPVSLWGAPDARHPFFLRCRSRFGVGLRRQSGGGLGERMAQAFGEMLRKHRYAVLVGTDCPALDTSVVSAALATLQAGRDAVFVPAEDGGYVLIGLRTPESRLFRGVRWGTGSVMAQTRARLGRLGLDWVELKTLWDVDHPRDMRRARRIILQCP